MILASVAALGALQTAPLEPSGKWVVDYGEDMCTVARPFGPEGITFGFRPDGFAGQGGMLVIIQPAKGGARYHEFKQKIELPSGAEAIPVSPKSYYFRDRKSRVVTMIVNAEELERLKAAPSFAVPVNARDHIAFAPAEFPAALKALDKCSDDLMAGYGVPVEELAQATIRTTARNPDRWFSWINYPAAALARGQQSRTVALIAVSAEGKPTDCRIVSNAGDDAFSKTTCDIVTRRGDFEPARNGAGEAIPSWTTLTINWEIG